MVTSRLLRPDAYGVLLLMIIAALVLTAADPPAGIVGFLLQAGCLLYGQWTSQLPTRWWWATGALVAVTVVIRLASAITGRPVLGTLTAASAVALGVATVAVILRRLVRHTAVTGSTVAGVICVYLLAGLTFGYGYRLAANLTGEPFFTAADATSMVDYLYFSFVTLTTVGYGDLTAASDLGRMLAVSEALLGQVYLVTVVALVVTNLGRQRDPEAIASRRARLAGRAQAPAAANEDLDHGQDR
jgi:Ion channel